LTDEQLTILYRGWLLAREGKGQVFEPWAYPEAHALSEQGWLERRFEPDGELSWWWTKDAETAFDLAALSRYDTADWN
jgi:hypothetical protein